MILVFLLLCVLSLFLYWHQASKKGILVITMVSLLECLLCFFYPISAVIYGITLSNIMMQLLYLTWYEKSSMVLLLLKIVIFLICAYLYILMPSLWMEVLVVLGYLTWSYGKQDVRKCYEDDREHYQKKLLKNQVDEVHNIYQTMRGWRHDYHNHLQSLKVKLHQSQIEEALMYLDELEQELDQIHLIVETGNINVDAILNSKLSLALNHAIALDVKVTLPPVFPMQDSDCCILLGNLIDNAIESCETVSEHAFIRLYIGVYKKQLYISVTNATNEVIRKLDEEYISKKRGNHGHGLKRIDQVVEKYDGYINRKNEPGVFVTEIMLPIAQNINQSCTK